MDPTEQIFTCLYQDHINEPINGFCLSLTCQEKPQCCSQCLMNKHQDHKGDCKTIAQLKQMFQMDVKEIPNLISQTNSKFLKVKKLQQSLTKLFTGERNKMIELEKKLKQPNYFLYNQDFISLKQLQNVIKQLQTDKQDSFLTSFIEEIAKMMKALHYFGLLNSDQLKQSIETIQKAIELKQNEVILYPDIFNNQIIAFCEQKNCCDQQQCCKLCVNDQNISIFEFIRPIIQQISQILNYWLLGTEKYFVQAQQLYLIMKLFFETQVSFLKEMEKFLMDQDFYEFMFQITKFKQSFQIKSYCLDKIKQDQLLKLLESFMVQIQTPTKFELSETIFHKQKVARKSNMRTKNQEINFLLQDLIYKGNALDKFNNYKDVIKCNEVQFDRAIKSNPNQYEVIYNKGKALTQLNCYEDAIQCYDQAIKLNPNQSDVFMNKGVVLCYLNRFEDAILCYDQAIKLNPNNSSAFQKKGISLQSLNRFTAAIQCFDQTIKLNPNGSEAYKNKGDALAQLKRYEDSIQCYDQAIKINPKYSDALMNKGVALCYLTNYEDALQFYDQAINLNPNCSETFNNKGNAVYCLKRYQEAISCFDQAIKINPKFADAFKNKGNALGHLNLYQDAITCYDQAIKLNPNQSKAFFKKGNALQKLKRYEDAVQCYSQAIQINPNNFEAFYNKGIALEHLNRSEDAIQCFDQAIKLNPKHQDAYNNDKLDSQKKKTEISNKKVEQLNKPYKKFFQ